MKKAGKWLGIVFGSLALLVVLVLGFFTVMEYRPKEREALTLENNEDLEPLSKERAAEGIRIMTFNIGYGGLGAEQDFFMDGGSVVRPSSKEVVEEYLEGIIGILREQKPDVLFLQEIDTNAKRSYGINELAYLNRVGDLPIGMVSSAYAKNFDAIYVPYPFPETIGRVKAGIVTWNTFRADSAERISLPTTYTWPIRTCQLKRCLLVERVPIEGSEKELVLVNLHLEAYDDGSGKAAQTAVLMDLLEEEYKKGNYCIAGGDFNQTFETTDTSAYPLIDTSYFEAGVIEEASLAEGFSFQADSTSPSARLLNQPYDPDSPKTQYYVIDGFLVSDNVEVEKVETLDYGFQYSDHNPVAIEVRLR